MDDVVQQLLAGSREYADWNTGILVFGHSCKTFRRGTYLPHLINSLAVRAVGKPFPEVLSGWIWCHSGGDIAAV